MTALIPPWASEITNSTPLSPRATSERRNAVQAAVSSVVAMSKPMISRVPSLLTAVAMTAATLTTRPPSHPLGQGVDPLVAVGATVKGTLLELGDDGVEF